MTFNCRNCGAVQDESEVLAYIGAKGGRARAGKPGLSPEQAKEIGAKGGRARKGKPGMSSEKAREVANAAWAKRKEEQKQ